MGLNVVYNSTDAGSIHNGIAACVSGDEFMLDTVN
jgi:hypothetical protein